MPFKIIKEDILKANEDTADIIRESLASNNTLMINIISSPGAGKTALIERIAPMLKDVGIKFSVLTGDCFTTNDATRIDNSGADAIQINTGNSCHIDAALIQKALNELKIEVLDLIIVENVGNLVCPAEFDLGEDYKIAVLSAPEGDDKPSKYPLIFSESELVIINKVDILEYLPFDIEECEKNIKNVNPKAQIIRTSSIKGDGLGDLLEWLKLKIKNKKER